MGYLEISLLRQDTAFLNRVAACYAGETPLGTGEDPDLWATTRAWDVAGQPGLGDAYGAAVVAANANPGSDPGVVSDAALLTAVQAVIAATPAPTP